MFLSYIIYIVNRTEMNNYQFKVVIYYKKNPAYDSLLGVLRMLIWIS